MKQWIQKTLRVMRSTERMRREEKGKMGFFNKLWMPWNVWKNGVLLMYKSFTPLDNFAILWYHARVKLGCFATAPCDLASSYAWIFDGSKRLRGWYASVFFRPCWGFDGLSVLPWLPKMSAVSDLRSGAIFGWKRWLFRYASAELPCVRLPGRPNFW